MYSIFIGGTEIYLLLQLSIALSAYYVNQAVKTDGLGGWAALYHQGPWRHHWHRFGFNLSLQSRSFIFMIIQCTVHTNNKKIISIGEISGKVTDIKENLTDEERMLMQMNKEKRAKYLAKKAAATA